MAAENQDMGSAPPVSVTGSVGTLLRESRERRGEDIGFVASALRIRQPYLQAIEDGEFENLPGSTYAVGFVRGYAEYLGLDSKEIVRRFRQENGELGNRAELVFPSAVSEGSIPTGALLVFAIVAAGAAYGAWYWYQSREAAVADAVPPLPERLAALIHRPVGNGSEVVPVTSPDAGKSADATQSAQGSPSAQTGAASAAHAGAPHEDIIPPSEEDTAPTAASGAAQPAASAASPAAAPVQPSAAATPPSPPAVQSVAKTPAAGDGAPSASPAKPADGKKDAAKPDTVKAAKPADVAVPTETAKHAEAPALAENTPKPPAAAPAAGEVKVTANASAEAKPETMPSPSQPPAESATGRNAATPGRVVLRANQDCWIEIRDGKGRIVLTRLMHRGESYPVPPRPGLVLTAGNAGALDLMVDGSSAGSLGQTGMVRRDVPLDAERLKDGIPPAPQPAAPDAPTTQPAGGASGE